MMGQWTTSATRGVAVVFAAVALCWCAPAAAQFHDAVQVSSAATGCSQPRVDRDLGDNIAFAYLCDGEIYRASTTFLPGVDVLVTDTPQPAEAADLRVGLAGDLRLVYAQVSSQPGLGTQDIITRTVVGGTTSSSVNVTFSSVDEFGARIDNNPAGGFAISWCRLSATGVEEVWATRDLAPNQLIAEGHDADIANDNTGLSTIVYERAGIPYLTTYDGAVPGAELALDFPPGASGFEVEAADIVHLLAVGGGSLHYANNEGGTFGAAEEIATGVDGGYGMSAGPDGEVSVVYSSAGQIYGLDRTAGTFGAPALITPLSTAAIEPAVVRDGHGYSHVAYAESGAIHYLNNVPTPVAEFTATPTSGELLLEVEFQDASGGVISDYLWDFGDGVTSTEPNPVHIYDTEGPKTVSLTVSGPGGSHTETKSAFIDALPPTNVLAIPTISVFATQAISHPVVATHTVGLQGFQLAIRYDQSYYPMESVSFESTSTGAQDPEFVIWDLTMAGPDSYLIVAVVLDLQEPFDGRVIEPGSDHMIALLNYTVPFTASLGTVAPLTFENGLGDPPINNIFSSDGQSLLPFLVDGAYVVDSLPGVTFLRGDATGDGAIDIADAVAILAYLFSGGTAPSCMDAADANDTGVIDVADAISLLDFLFGTGSAPAYPFPVPGLDPSADSLPICP